jgi:hypothetical protein
MANPQDQSSSLIEEIFFDCYNEVFKKHNVQIDCYIEVDENSNSIECFQKIKEKMAKFMVENSFSVEEEYEINSEAHNLILEQLEENNIYIDDHISFMAKISLSETHNIDECIQIIDNYINKIFDNKVVVEYLKTGDDFEISLFLENCGQEKELFLEKIHESIVQLGIDYEII